ncbi:hypothetical protein MesoLjLc_39100 [Mesorhizobium sp. L-8-10]|uniref:hypothetical protein n=1 Tax=Mesorhizobium sp. L-8-10 TaxID=2744523 RepID=UPI001925D920|nr:hypothetical protein [Mesorhizobium sp. L-8-10]BCH31980.1 hypothetical protein MesoLjLc_39100 [Mesorhizobium sp. L-8-10]
MKIPSLTPFMIAIPLLCFAGLGPAFSSCGIENAPRGISLSEESCKSWPNAEIPETGDYYAALQFSFELLDNPQSSANSKGFLQAVSNVFTAADTDEVMLTIKPKLGGTFTTEVPVYSYKLDGKARTGSLDARYDFATPYVRYDQDALGFKIVLRGGSKVKTDVGGVLTRLTPLLGAAGASPLLSAASKGAIDAGAAIVDELLTSMYSAFDKDEVEFEMASETSAGAVERTILMSSPGNPAQKIGRLVVRLKLKRSLRGTPAMLPNDNLSKATTNFSPGQNLIGFPLPSIDSRDRTILSGLTSEEVGLKAVATVQLQDEPGDDLRSACSDLKASSYSRFGLNNVDSLRLLYELLDRGNRRAALVEDAPDCFGREDWALIKGHTVFEVEERPSRADKPSDDTLNYFATALRSGFAANPIYAAQLADSVEISGTAAVEGLGGECDADELDKPTALVCLDKLKVNRWERDDLPSGRTSILVTTRAQITEAIGYERERRIAGANLTSGAPDADLARDRAVARAATEHVDHAIRITLYVDDKKKINRIKLEKETKEEIGTNVLSRIALSCWANGPNETTAFCMRNNIGYEAPGTI